MFSTSEPPTVPCRPTTLAGDLCVALTRAVRRIRQERSCEQITDGQYAALAALSGKGPMTPTALADDQHVQPPYMTRVVNGLVSAGLARRDEHPTDRRQVVVSITDTGTAELHETRRRRDAWLDGQLGRFDEAERELLARAVVLLRRFAE
jgi:DNA-binding MarR family transcriptional regulator